MRRLLQLVVISFFFLLISTAVSAHLDVFTEHMHEFKNETSIQEDGTIKVQEKITYDFINQYKHGIYRNIPYIKTNAEGKKFKMDINVQSVTDENGKAYNYTTSDSDGEISLKIGDANKTITGVHIYIITYKVAGALTYFSDHDELYWNMTGDSWEVPIEVATTTITLPQKNGAVFNKAVCYTGATGSTATDCSVNIEGSSATIVTNHTLDGHEGLTVVLSFPKNIVSVLEPKEQISFFDTPLGKVVLTILIIVGAILALWWYLLYPLWLPFKWYLHGRDPMSRLGITEARFEAPQTKDGRLLTPAETGTLIDEFAGQAEISALMIHLAQRGYFKIVEKGKNDFELQKQKDYKNDSKLQDFEKKLLTDLFSSKNTVKLKDAKLYDTVIDIQDKLYNSLIKEGYFPKNPQKIRNFYNGIIVASSVTFNFLLLLIAGIFGRLMPRKTMEGVHGANEARSLKKFLTTQERQLEFQAKNQMMFEKLLPYAIAFGVEKIWAERFKDIDMKPPDWYVSSSTGRFNSVIFANSLRSSTSSFAKAATPTTSSSGFSSGFSGGSSGGGGGGGGGGSW